MAEDIGSVNVHVSNNIISSQEGILLWNDEVLYCPYTSNWVFFVDDMPFVNWEHPCRYIFVNAETGEYQVVDKNIHPENFVNDFELIDEIQRPEPINLPINPDATLESREPNEHLYAVIICAEDGYLYRYWRDVSAIYCTLIDVYGYTKENIFVHYYYGYSNYSDDLDDPLDPSDDIDYSAYKTRIDTTFKNLSGEWTNDPDVPELGPDDQLFIFADNHGSGDGQGHSWICLPGPDLHDYELAGYLAPINCSQIIFVSETCKSGGFIDDLTDYVTYNVQCENRVIHTACDYDEPSACEMHITDWYYDEFVYYWTSAARGYYPVTDQPWELADSVGYFPFEDFPTLINHPPDYDPDDPAYGGNGDGFVQMGEAFQYANNWDTWSPYGYFCMYPGYTHIENPQDSTTIGFQEDLLSLYGLCGNVSNSQTVTGNFMVSPSLTIGPEVTLTLDNDSRFMVINGASVTLFGRSLVEVTNGSEFQLKAGSSLYGTDHTVYEDPATGERYVTWEEAYQNIPNIGAEHEIPGDRIITKDGGSFDAYAEDDDPSNRVTISAVDNNRWDGIELNDPSSINLFNYCDVSKMSYIKINNANFNFRNSTFTNGNQIIARNNSFLSLSNCILDGFNACPIVSYESHNLIGQCDITNNNGNGISIYYPSVSGNVIGDNDIQNNSYWGISYYDTPVFSRYNDIVENGSHGLVALGSSGTPVMAGNLISNNVGAELISNRLCFPDLTSYIGTYGPNTIVDDVNSGGVDNYLLMCGNYDGNRIDVRGNNFPNENDPDFEDRFYPFYDAYIFDGEKPPERILYEEGIVEIADSLYESAKLKMKEIVDDYPETETAIGALQWLMYLEKFSGHDYVTLRNYIVNIDEVSYPHLERTKYNTITSSYMAEKDYEAAITRLEAILSDPPSTQDSIFAYIDEGYCYLKLEEEGGKATPVKCTFKPHSFNEFKYVSQNLTKNLFDKAIPTSGPPTTDPQTIEFTLNQNYPNPAYLSTTFSFSIPVNTKNAELKIYNIKGQLVKTFIPVGNEKGTTNNLKWDCKDENGKTLCNGIYFYKLTADKNEIVKKMVLMR